MPLLATTNLIRHRHLDFKSSLNGIRLSTRHERKLFLSFFHPSLFQLPSFLAVSLSTLMPVGRIKRTMLSNFLRLDRRGKKDREEGLNKTTISLTIDGNHVVRMLHFVEHYGVFYKTLRPIGRGERAGRFNDLCRSPPSPVTWPHRGRLNFFIQRSQIKL